jgi:hypothetical protein
MEGRGEIREGRSNSGSEGNSSFYPSTPWKNLGLIKIYISKSGVCQPCCCKKEVVQDAFSYNNRVNLIQQQLDK